MTARAREEAIRNFAARGFSMPGGALVEPLARADQEAIDKSASLSREIAIKQAELEQTNFQFAFGQAIALEGQLLNHANAVSQRAFEAARFTAQIAIDLFNAAVNLFNAKSQAYQVEAVVYRERLQAEIAKVEIYKAQVEGQRITSEVNQQTVALTASASTPSSPSSSCTRTSSRPRAFSRRATRPASRPTGPRSRPTIHWSRPRRQNLTGTRRASRARRSRPRSINRWPRRSTRASRGTRRWSKPRSRRRIGVSRSTRRLPLDKYRVQSQTFQTLVQAEAERLRGLIGLFEGRVKAFGAQVDAEGTRVNAEVQVLRGEVETKVATANVALENVKANIQRLVEIARMVVGATQAGAQVASQLASAALSAVNLSASISAGGSFSSSGTSSTSESFDCTKERRNAQPPHTVTNE